MTRNAVPDPTRAHAIQIVDTVRACRKRREPCPECEAAVMRALQQVRREGSMEALERLLRHLRDDLGAPTGEVRMMLTEYRRQARVVEP